MSEMPKIPSVNRAPMPAPAASGGIKGVSSPYSSGGGGVTLERRVTARYLALLLTGHGAGELGSGRRVLGVAVQQAPAHPVDDLVISAGRYDHAAPSLVLTIGIRRAPVISSKNADTQKLFADFVRDMLATPQDGVEHRLGLAVAGWQAHSSQLQQLAVLARAQPDPDKFEELIGTKGKINRDLEDRLKHVKGLVRRALSAQQPDPDESVLARRTWELLSSLHVLMLRVEEPDTLDWDETVRLLTPIARGNTPSAAENLLERLEVLAGQYGPTAAVIDQQMLRRDVHPLLAFDATLHAQAWAVLNHLQDQAIVAVRGRIGRGRDEETFTLDHSAERARLVGLIKSASGVFVHGESGTGKSSLTITAVRDAAAGSGGDFQAVCLDLRNLPGSSLELIHALGCRLEVLLGELSAPTRVLVVDGADAAVERSAEMFRYLLSAAAASEVRVAAVASAESRQVVADLMRDSLSGATEEHEVQLLDDAALTAVAARFPQLARLIDHPRSAQLLRRLVVVDLLVRSNVSGVPTSDLEAMTQVWSGLIRRGENPDRGQPEARQHVMLRLAEHELTGSSALEVAGRLDAAAVAGLQQDGLLRSASDDPWDVVPGFAHDEIRRYATTRVLMADRDPAGVLLAAGAPRWAMPAARLASQALLAAPTTPSNPVAGRLVRVQEDFDRISEAGHGERWSDVPSEALLTLGDPVPLLTDAWPVLRGGTEAVGVRRLIRLIDQRHRIGPLKMLDIVVAEPVVALLLDEQRPWDVHRDVADLLRNFLAVHAAMISGAGQVQRVRVRERLIECCAAGDERLAEQQREAALVRAARTPDQVEADARHEAQNRALSGALGQNTRRRPNRSPVPRELIEDIVLELIALLGADLGVAGEALLRRVARDAPQHLAPAVEEAFTDRALAQYSKELLADLTEAYYIDEYAGGTGLHDEGIRHHHWRGPITPMAAFYRGPFLVLFQTDPVRGIPLLNRMLNHAARCRARKMARLGDPWRSVPEYPTDYFQVELEVAGEPRTYAGDEHVWRWYRGSGVGPYPCMSALQALELLADGWIAQGMSLESLTELLQQECENLAMLGLIVGLLVRHLERAGTLLDAYLTEPEVWHLEFTRMANNVFSVLPADTEERVHSERRHWSLREASTYLVLGAEGERIEQLKSLGDQLVAKAERLIDAETDGDQGTDGAAASILDTARGWAAGLDRSRYRSIVEDGTLYIQAEPTEEVRAALEANSEDRRRNSEAMRLQWRYALEPKAKPAAPKPVDAELAADIETAKDLWDNPPTMGVIEPWGPSAAVCATALEAHFLHGTKVSAEDLEFSAAVLLQVAGGAFPPLAHEFEETYFEQGADRAAARGLPLILLLAARELCNKLVLADGTSGEAQVTTAVLRLAQTLANETRLHLARGLDPLWAEPCTSTGACHHRLALDVATETLRDCVLGAWDPTLQRRAAALVSDPVAETLVNTAADDVHVGKLDAALRAYGAAAASSCCVRAEARELLLAVLAVQRRVLSHEPGYDDRGNHTFAAARALLALAATGSIEPLLEHVEAYMLESELLYKLLRALNAVAEESPRASEATRGIWPQVIEHALALHAAGRSPFDDGYLGQAALATLIPTPTYETEFMYRELDADPIAWTDIAAWYPQIVSWLPVAAGKPQCATSLIALLEPLPIVQQARMGLPWIRALVLPSPATIVHRSAALTQWLTVIRSTAVDIGLQQDWQETVDALVVAGDTALAPYSE